MCTVSIFQRGDWKTYEKIWFISPKSKNTDLFESWNFFKHIQQLHKNNDNITWDMKQDIVKINKILRDGALLALNVRDKGYRTEHQCIGV